jgi:toxin ParE1/3/4
MLPVIRTEQAESDLQAILAYLDERSPAAAERLATTIDERCRLLGEFPQMGRPRDNLAPGLRSIVVESYVRFFRPTATAVEILRIFHGARDIETIMKSED